MTGAGIDLPLVLRRRRVVVVCRLGRLDGDRLSLLGERVRAPPDLEAVALRVLPRGLQQLLAGQRLPILVLQLGHPLRGALERHTVLVVDEPDTAELESRLALPGLENVDVRHAR